MSRTRISLWLTACALPTLSLHATAQSTSTWIPGAGGPYEFSTPAHWTPGVPGPGDTGLLDPSGTVVIQAAGSVSTSVPVPGGPTHYTATQQVEQLRFLGGSTTLSGGALQALAAGGEGLWVEGPNGTLTLDDFELITEGVARLGATAGQTGAMVVTGPTASWRSNANESGGWLAVGNLGAGHLTVEGGGYVSGSLLTIGDFYESPDSSVTVTGVGSTVECDVLDVGRRGGHASLDVVQGGVAHGRDFVTLGVFPQFYQSPYPHAVGKGLVQGAGSELGVTAGELTVGLHTSGELTIESGGTAWSQGLCSIGRYLGGGGAVTVRGLGSSLEAGKGLSSGEVGLEVGPRFSGSLLIEQGGLVSAGQATIRIGNTEVTGVGTTTLRDPGSRLEGRALELGGADSLTGGTGTLRIESGALVTLQAPSQIGKFGQLVLDQGTLEAPNMVSEGTIDGHGTIRADTTSALSLRPGLPIGELVIDGDLSLTKDNVLDVELGTLATTGDHDLVTVTGNVTLDGHLRLQNVGGFVPSCGDSFDIIKASSVSGSFSSATIQLLPHLPLRVETLGGTVRVSVLPQVDLSADVGQVQLAAGGTQNLTLAGGECSAGMIYVLLGSTSSTPGIAVDGVHLPLDVTSPYFTLTLTSPGTSPLSNILGSFGISGSASETVTIPSGLDPALSGLVLYHAYAVLSPTLGVVVDASPAVALTLQ